MKEHGGLCRERFVHSMERNRAIPLPFFHVGSLKDRGMLSPDLALRMEESGGPFMASPDGLFCPGQPRQKIRIGTKFYFSLVFPLRFSAFHDIIFFAPGIIAQLVRAPR